MNDTRGCDHPYFVLWPVAEAGGGPAVRAVACGVCELVVGSVNADVAALIAERHPAGAPTHVPAGRRRPGSRPPRRGLRRRDRC
jgi:hypothetical protein